MQINKKIQIDGRHGEGGGQLLRTALTLSSLCQVPLYMNHIRGNRKKPGLRSQHLLAITSLATITKAEVQGATIDSHELIFEPGEIHEGNYSFHIGTAGSTSLVLQAMMPVLLAGKMPSQIQITGGTHVPWSPSFHYIKTVFLPVLKTMGGNVTIEIDKWGWYPKGGGSIRAVIKNTQGLKAIHFSNRGKLRYLHILSAVSNLPLSIAERQRDQSIKRLEHLRLKPTTSIANAPSYGQGTVLFLHAQFEGGVGGFSSLGKKGKSAEEVADDACNEFIKFFDSNGVIDIHLADQLVLYMALARGRSTLITERITEHLLTNIWVIEQFLPVTFDIERETGKIEVDGIGFR
ncbi:MAG: RNA 3'-phosphate cyclase [Deltaproteobacteria bacterium]|nr:RNA 3'-phosphate cyclase [Deltaproteobacteria bacterium]MBW2106085.1 RNA 3'-phosphate cyclase [Deltaproteobacteria bacterium]MBW2333228.1 RNA 3'-phosphate cyclase [Deltaproteobacteria bacterium]